MLDPSPPVLNFLCCLIARTTPDFLGLSVRSILSRRQAGTTAFSQKAQLRHSIFWGNGTMKMSKETPSAQISSIRSTCTRNLKTCLSLKGKSTLKYSDIPRDKSHGFIKLCVSMSPWLQRTKLSQKVFKELIPPISWLSPPPSLQPSWVAVCCPLVEKRCYWLRKSTNIGLKSHKQVCQAKGPPTHRHIPKVDKTSMHHQHRHAGSPCQK